MGQSKYPYGAQPIDPGKVSHAIGLVSTQGGDVILDQPFNVPGSQETQVSSHLHVGMGGTILCRSFDGTINPYFGVVSGGTIVVKATEVVSTATLNTGVFSTTADQITWHGGQ